jgi:hypothetical protein
MVSGTDLPVWQKQIVLTVVIQNLNKYLPTIKTTVIFVFIQKINLTLCPQILMYLVLTKNKTVYLGILDNLVIFAQKVMKNFTILKYVKKLFILAKQILI